MIFELHPIGVCDMSLRGASPLCYSTIPVFKGDVPSEPPTAYKKPPSTATATPNLLVLMEATRVHLFSLGSYLKEECPCITTIIRSGKHIWFKKGAMRVNYLKNWRRYFTLRFGRIGLISFGTTNKSHAWGWWRVSYQSFRHRLSNKNDSDVTGSIIQ